jgi:hypothetical protein
VRERRLVRCYLRSSGGVVIIVSVESKNSSTISSFWKEQRTASYHGGSSNKKSNSPGPADVVVLWFGMRLRAPILKARELDRLAILERIKVEFGYL